jgi:hypothetical protein
MTIRERIAALAEAYANVGVTKTRDAYLALVAPNDSRTDYFAHPKTSGCALVVRGLWRLAGLEHPTLVAPYRIGHAIVDVVDIAKESRAWHAGTERKPELGDVVLVGAPSHEHVHTVVKVDGDAIESIDGGQLDGFGQQVITRKSRRWVAGNDVLDGGFARPIVGTVDVGKMPFKFVGYPQE